MGRRRRGRDRPETCSSCGRTVPRDKAVSYTKRSRYSTDLRGKEGDISFQDFRTVYYCVSCAKHRKIFEKKKKAAQKRREREMYGGDTF